MLIMSKGKTKLMIGSNLIQIKAIKLKNDI